MKNNKFASLGLLAIAISLNACTPYSAHDKNYELSKDQKSVSLTLGDSFVSNFYNVKEPIDVVFKAEEGYKIMINNVEYPTYRVHINPQESIDLKFNVYKNGSDKPIEIETHVNTFKEVFKPSHRIDLTEKSGKYSRDVGYKNYYALNKNQKEVLIDLHEHNKREKHFFYYLNANHDVTIRMSAPKYTSFVFPDGTTTKQYSFTMKAGEDPYFSMQLMRNDTEQIYSRTYKFIHRR